MLKSLFKLYSNYQRKKRATVFLRNVPLKDGDRILDLGGGNGRYLRSLLPPGYFDVYVADISENDLAVAKSFGYKTIHLTDENGKVPVEDKFFDVVFCNSVIEHVTVDKKEMYAFTSTKAFEERAFERQLSFAKEIERISKNYFVQTPNRYFILEAHSWFLNVYPFISRKNQIKLLAFLNKFWPKKTEPDWNLLSAKQMHLLFPGSTLLREKSLGLTKSFMAVRSELRAI